MRHQSQKDFPGIFVGITQHKKGYLIYVPSTCKIVSSHEIAFDETFYIVLAYNSLLYSEALDMQPAVSYITYAVLFHEQTSDIVNCAQCEEGNLAENELNAEEDEPILSSIDESSIYDDSYEIYISTNALEDI